MVVRIAERVAGQVPAVLVGGLEHVEQAPVIVVQVIGVKGFVPVHSSLQEYLSEFVREGVMYVPVLVRDAGHTQAAR